MPFRSKKQRKYLYARHPKIAKRWTEKYGSKINPYGRYRRSEEEREKRHKIRKETV